MKAYMKIVKAEPVIKTNMDGADYVALLCLKKDVPVDDEDWRIIPCPKCGQECQITPEDELLIERGARYICTECVLGARKEQKTMTMTMERAIEILDPTHRERYSDLPDGIEQVNEACRMGVMALERGIKKSPHPDGDKNILACWCCGSGEYLYNEDGNRNDFCGQCGQRIDWSEDSEGEETK